jgi:hypothetical protein
MKKVLLDYSDWRAILFGETGLQTIEQELFDYISKLASRSDVDVILSENEKPAWVLKYDTNTGEFSEYQIGEI